MFFGRRKKWNGKVAPFRPYAQLSDMLSKIGVNENEKNIANKISRGVFTLAFFLQCMSAIEVSEVRL